MTLLLFWFALTSLLVFWLAPHAKLPSGQGGSGTTRGYGWPTVHATLQVQMPPPTYEPIYSPLVWNVSALVFNLLTCTVLLVCTLVAGEVWMRGRRNRQFSLKGLVHLLAVTAVLFALLSGQLERSFQHVGLPLVHIADWNTVLSPMGWQLMVGITATTYVLVRGVSLALTELSHRLLARLHRNR